MKVSTVIKLSFSLFALLAIKPPTALGQTQERCSLQQISDALNQLDCEVNGAFVSPESLAQSIASVCEYTPTSEICHFCFLRAQRKLFASLRPLVFLGVLPPSTPVDLADALQRYEDSTCSSKDPEEPDLEDGEDGPPNTDAPELNRGHGSERSGLRRGGRPSQSSGSRRPHRVTRRGR